jgi:signal transduction histidine kinase
MDEKQEFRPSALAQGGLGGDSRGWMKARPFGVTILSFWPMQIGGWTFSSLFPLIIWLTQTINDPSLIWLSTTRPISGFLVTLALRPYCSKVFQRGINPYLLMPVIVIAAITIGWAELKGASWLCRIGGLADLPQQIWVGVWVYRSISLLVWLLLYFGIKSFVRHSEIEREFQRSEIRLLRSQVNPHFLFNALTTIMAVRKEEEKVALVTQSLADYLRFSLSQEEANPGSHPLGQELDALEDYLQVERIRFQKNLETRMDVTAEARAARVPSALVQPLLENAIKYGQQTSPLPLRIGITAQVSGGKLHLTVENTGRWVEPGLARSSGIGIANLRKRLQLLYGAEAELSFDRSEAAVKAQVSIPIQAAA